MAYNTIVTVGDEIELTMLRLFLLVAELFLSYSLFFFLALLLTSATMAT